MVVHMWLLSFISVTGACVIIAFVMVTLLARIICPSFSDKVIEYLIQVSRLYPIPVISYCKFVRCLFSPPLLIFRNLQSLSILELKLEIGE